MARLPAIVLLKLALVAAPGHHRQRLVASSASSAFLIYLLQRAGGLEARP